VFETYRMLGREREKELLAEGERLQVLMQHRRKRHLPATVFVITALAVAALLVWLGTSGATT
jgi:hypothetical protein